ncbi:MAG: hypothetical protein N2171_04800 [Clostridia bacterium]|nr:hypothetical protein [Clostridia bacterium]
MSRFCMYCGKELTKDEQCNCVQSAKARAEKQQAQQFNQQNFKKPSEFKKRHNIKDILKAIKFKKNVNMKRVKNQKSSLKEFGNLIMNFFKDPVYTVSNPGSAGALEAIILNVILGIVLSFIVFSSPNNINRSILNMLSKLISFGGTAAYVRIGNALLSIISITAFTLIQFFVLSMIFHFINRFIFKRYTDFWDIAVRLSLASLPVTAMGFIGLLFAFLSMNTVILMLFAGYIASVILSYEALRAQWRSVSPEKVLYIMTGGYFLYFSVCYSLFEIFLG